MITFSSCVLEVGFTVPGWFFMVPGWFSWFLWFQVGFSFFTLKPYSGPTIQSRPSFGQNFEAEFCLSL